MSHDPNSIPPADREFNELYRAAQGNQSSHAPDNTKLNSVKNNPSRDGLTVKHSDFFVSEVSKTIQVDTVNLKRSQTTRVQVSFVGEQTGFREEIKCNPNNFTWYAKPGYEHLIRVYTGSPATHPNSADWDHKDGDQYGAFQVIIKNIAPCSDEDVEAFICCKFKDDFNETIGASKGYDTELTGRIVCRKNLLTCDVEPVRNTSGGMNTQSTRAYDNELEYDHSGTTGQNHGTYDTPTAAANRIFKSLLDNNQDLLLDGSLKGDNFGLDLINGVSCVWQKEKENSDGTTEWIDLPLVTQSNYQPLLMNQFKSNDNANGNVGQLSSWYQGGIFSRDSKPRLNVQGGFGGGKYRAKVTVTGDPEDPFSCTFNSNDVSLDIIQRMSPFSVQGVGYGCAGDPITLTVSPVKYARSDSGVSNSDILYQVIQINDGEFKTIAEQTRDNTGDPFTWTVTGGDDGYYTVKAFLVPNSSTTIQPGDSYINGYALRYASDRISTGWDRGRTPATCGEWYNTAPYRRRTIPEVETPQITEGVGKNMSATRLRWRWNAVANPVGGALTYEVRLLHKSQDGGWLERTPWTSIGGARVYEIDDALDSPDVSKPDAETLLIVRAKIVPPTTGIAPGDTGGACYSKVIATNQIKSRNCNTIRSSVPVVTYNATSNIKGNDRPIFNLSYANDWTPALLEKPLQANFVNISVKSTGANDNTYVDFTDTIAAHRNLTSSVVTLGGDKYIQYGTDPWFVTDYDFGRGKTVRFMGKTRWTDEVKSCYTPEKVSTISTIVSEATFSWSGERPTSYAYGSHYGTTRGYSAANFSGSFSIGGSASLADFTRFGFGIGCDNLPDFAVTGVHEQDGMVELNYKGAGLAIRQLPQPMLGGSAKWPSVTLKVIGSTNPSGATTKHTIGIYYPVSSTMPSDILSEVRAAPGWVLHMKKNTAGRTYNGKELQSNTIMRTQFSHSDRTGATTDNNSHYENLNASSRIVSQRTEWGPMLRSVAHNSYTDYHNLSWEYNMQDGAGRSIDPTGSGATSVIFEISKSPDMSNVIQSHSRTLSAAGLSSTNRSCVFLFRDLESCTEYYTRMRIIVPGKTLLESNFQISGGMTNPCTTFFVRRSTNGQNATINTTPNINVTGIAQKSSSTAESVQIHGLVRPLANDQYGNMFLAVGEGRSTNCSSNTVDASGKLFFDTGFLKYGNIRYTQGSAVHSQGWKAEYASNIYGSNVPAEYGLMANAIKYCSSNRRTKTKKVLYFNDTVGTTDAGGRARSYPVSYFNKTLDGICSSSGYSMSYLSGITGDQSPVIYGGILPNGWNTWRSYFASFDAIIYMASNYDRWGNINGYGTNTNNTFLYGLLEAVDYEAVGLIVVTDHDQFQYNANQVVRHFGIQFSGNIDRTQYHNHYLVSNLLSNTDYIRNGYHPLFDQLPPTRHVSATVSEGRITYDSSLGTTVNKVSDSVGDVNLQFGSGHNGKIIIKDANDCGDILL